MNTFVSFKAVDVCCSNSRVVDDLEFLSFLESEVIFSASIVVVQSYKESDSTTCRKAKQDTWEKAHLPMSITESTSF